MNPKTALITGSSRGIGLAIAQEFATHSYNIILNNRKSTQELNDAHKLISSTNTSIDSITADVSDYDQALAMFDRITNRFGNVDILINNAGVDYIGLFQDMRPEQWRSVIDINLNSVMNCTHLAIPSMIENKHGVIVNISSVWGQAGASCEAVYAASKAGVDAFTRSIAKELGPSGIRVNAVACGAIDTDMNNWLSENEKTAINEQIPLMRFGSAMEIAQLVYYLCSDQAGYITGQIINADGGWL